MSGAILLTGATGFLGMETLAQLIDQGQRDIVVLIRAEDADGAQRRLAAIMASLYDEPERAGVGVRAMRGDLLEPGLGLSREDRLRLLESVEGIIHCAASISFDLPLGDARAINVAGVGRVVELAREIAAVGALRRLVHVSTAYVSGRHAGSFGEDDLDVGQAFRNTYEQSKHEAEHQLREAEDLPVVIARPSIVVGHRSSGWTPAFNVIYWPMRAAERGLLEEVPAHRDSIVDFVPVDYVAEGLIALLEHPQAHGVYHLVAGRSALTTGQLVESHASLLGRVPVRLAPLAAGSQLPQGAEAYLPYFDVRCSFDDVRARSLLRSLNIEGPAPKDHLGPMIDYAHTTRWGKQPLTRQAALRRVPLALGPAAD
jgi:thioester reductase-like protein